MLALGVPSSSLSSIVPAVAVYLISWPPILRECLVGTLFSSGTGGFFSSFGFSAGLSAALSGCGCDCRCWARQRFAVSRSTEKPGHRIECLIGGKAPRQPMVNEIRDVRHRMRESGQRQLSKARRWLCRCQMLWNCANSWIECRAGKKLSQRSSSCGAFRCQVSLCLY